MKTPHQTCGPLKEENPNSILLLRQNDSQFAGMNPPQSTERSKGVLEGPTEHDAEKGGIRFRTCKDIDPNGVHHKLGPFVDKSTAFGLGVTGGLLTHPSSKFFKCVLTTREKR